MSRPSDPLKVRGSCSTGPSEEYQQLLRGEINSKEYVEALERRVYERLEETCAAEKPVRFKRLLGRLS